ncbi:NAD(P)/FAD-dependent oxidoreductase [Pseudooceanicola sp. 200-1SW]|uniref:NAD(P)/FAD-dependent oxidoreductase n=1 Tax=Pseudooceanicola sp. 200-1SW TaxID=3425949 RepID=UPI003D7FA93D
MRVVIVGAGQGGLQAAMSLRQEGHEGPITLIGAEPGLPYQRPPLSKAYLKTGEAAKLTLRPEAFFDKAGIDLVSDTRIDSIDRAARQVRAGDRVWAYDHLILATGTRNLRPPIPGLSRALDLRSLADAERLRAALAGAKAPAVIGGGFIGLEFTAVARGLGYPVTLAEAAPRLMARAVSPQMSARFTEKHAELGTDIRLGQPVVEVTGEGLCLGDGTQVPADLVLLAAGVLPNTELAEAAGLTLDNGIAVDAQLRSSDPAISALGDCASFPEARRGRRVRLESVQAATDHARAIAKRLVKGDDSPYAAVPWFWSDQADWKLQIAGLAQPTDAAVTAPSGAILRFDGPNLSAVESVNDAKTHMTARKLLRDLPPDRDTLDAIGYDLTRI